MWRAAKRAPVAWLLSETRSMFLMSGPLSLSIVDASFWGQLDVWLGGGGGGQRPQIDRYTADELNERMWENLTRGVIKR